MKKRNYRQQALRLTPEQAAYVAGFVDGEGCITASIRKGYVYGLLELCSTDFDVVDWLVATTGVGSVRKISARRKNAKPQRMWRVSLCSVGSLLKQVIPHMRVRKGQAELLLKLAEYEYPSRLVDGFQIEAVEKFRQMNRRGAVSMN